MSRITSPPPQPLECVLGVRRKGGRSGSQGRAECGLKPLHQNSHSPTCTEGGPRCLWSGDCAVTQTDTEVSGRTGSSTKEQVWVVPGHAAPEPLPGASDCPAVPHLSSAAPAQTSVSGAGQRAALPGPRDTAVPVAVPPPDTGPSPKAAQPGSNTDWLTSLECLSWLAGCLKASGALHTGTSRRHCAGGKGIPLSIPTIRSARQFERSHPPSCEDVVVLVGRGRWLSQGGVWSRWGNY